MTDAEFETTYLQTLHAIEEAIEAAIDEGDLGLEYETVNDILSLEFEDDSVIIITKQGATQQLWLAAVSGGFHFYYDEHTGQWLSTTGQLNLAERLSESCQQQGAAINFNGIQQI
jgi:CyaY protein